MVHRAAQVLPPRPSDLLFKWSASVLDAIDHENSVSIVMRGLMVVPSKSQRLRRRSSRPSITVPSLHPDLNSTISYPWGNRARSTHPKHPL